MRFSCYLYIVPQGPWTLDVDVGVAVRTRRWGVIRSDFPSIFPFRVPSRHELDVSFPRHRYTHCEHFSTLLIYFPTFSKSLDGYIPSIFGSEFSA